MDLVGDIPYFRGAIDDLDAVRVPSRKLVIGPGDETLELDALRLEAIGTVAVTPRCLLGIDLQQQI